MAGLRAIHPCPRASVVMAVRAMRVAVRDFLGGGGLHILDLEAEAQRLAGMRVVAVQDHLRTLDLDHGEDALAAVIGHAAQGAADLDAGFGAGDTADVGELAQQPPGGAGAVENSRYNLQA